MAEIVDSSQKDLASRKQQIDNTKTESQIDEFGLTVNKYYDFNGNLLYTEATDESGVKITTFVDDKGNKVKFSDVPFAKDSQHRYSFSYFMNVGENNYVSAFQAYDKDGNGCYDTGYTNSGKKIMQE